MRGDELLAELAKRIQKQNGTKSVSDSVLAKLIGVTQPQLANYRGKELTARQVVNLVEKYAKFSEKQLIDSSVVPIFEFLHIDPIETKLGSGQYQLFCSTNVDGKSHPYLRGIEEALKARHLRFSR